eukprot:8290765-Alexandrium_andersonii.AAC.1
MNTALPSSSMQMWNAKRLGLPARPALALSLPRWTQWYPSKAGLCCRVTSLRRWFCSGTPAPNILHMGVFQNALGR